MQRLGGYGSEEDIPDNEKTRLLSAKSSNAPLPPSSSASSSVVANHDNPQDLFLTEEDEGAELATIRQLLTPPEIHGTQDWDIPPPSSKECEPSIVAKLNQFHTLKHHPTQPKHFNDSLMSNQSFLNPHLLDQMVDFVNIDEGTSNFPTSNGMDMWDWDQGPRPSPDWYSDSIAQAQKTRYEQESSGSSRKKRNQIDFTQSTSSLSISAGHPPVGPRNHSVTHLPTGTDAKHHVGGVPIGPKHDSGHSHQRYNPYGSHAVGGVGGAKRGLSSNIRGKW